MSQKPERRGRTGDPVGTTSTEIAHYVAHRCFICGRADAESTMVLGGNTVGGGTRVPRCGNGVGCRDGRIYHGPQGRPHWPNEGCEICERSGEPAIRRQAHNAARQSSPGNNRSPWHL